MLVVQEDLIQAVLPFQPLSPVAVGKTQGPVLIDPVYRSRDFFRNQPASLPEFLHIQEFFQRIPHGHQKAQQNIVGQVVLVQGENGHDVPALPGYNHRRGAGVPGMAFPNPHFRPKHQKRRIMAAGHRNTGRTHVLLQHPHALDIFDASLEERHGVVFQYVADFIHQQHTQIMAVEILLVLFKQAVHILDYILLQLQLVLQLAGRQAHPIHRHGFMVQFPGFAPAPGFGHPGMHVGIQNPFVDKFVVVAGQLIFIASFSNHLVITPRLISGTSAARNPVPELAWRHNTAYANNFHANCINAPRRKTWHSRTFPGRHKCLHGKPPVHRW